jgi:hypothetical protein
MKKNNKDKAPNVTLAELQSQIKDQMIRFEELRGFL